MYNCSILPNFSEHKEINNKHRWTFSSWALGTVRFADVICSSLNFWHISDLKAPLVERKSRIVPVCWFNLKTKTWFFSPDTEVATTLASVCDLSSVSLLFADSNTAESYAYLWRKIRAQGQPPDSSEWLKMSWNDESSPARRNKGIHQRAVLWVTLMRKTYEILADCHYV